MRLRGSYFAVLLILVSLMGGVGNAAASGGGKGAVPTVKSLINRDFRSVKLRGNPVLKGRTIRLGFFRASLDSGQPKKPKMLVDAGCNNWSVNFRVRRSRLFAFGTVETSDVECSNDPDPWLRRQFRKGLKVRRVGQRLVLTRPAAKVRLVFQGVAGKPGKVDESDPDPEPRVTIPATKEDVDGKHYELIATIGKKLGRGLRMGFWDVSKMDGSGDVRQISSINFFAGCNHMAGEYGIEDGILSVSNVDTTDMWCQNSDDPWLVQFLNSGPKIGLDGSDLVLRRNGIELVLEEQAPPPQPRVTVPATLDDVLGNSYEAYSVIGPKLDRPLKAAFSMGTWGSPGDMFTAPAFTYRGCNHFGGRAEIEGGILIWKDVISTLIACQDSADEWLTPLFRNKPEIGLDGTDLVIRKNGIEIVFRRADP